MDSIGNIDFNVIIADLRGEINTARKKIKS